MKKSSNFIICLRLYHRGQAPELFPPSELLRTGITVEACGSCARNRGAWQADSKYSSAQFALPILPPGQVVRERAAEESFGLLPPGSRARSSPAAPCGWSVVGRARTRGPEGRRGTPDLLCEGVLETLNRHGAAAPRPARTVGGGLRTERLGSCAGKRNLAGKARVFDIALWRATGMPASDPACRNRLSRAGSETGAPSRHDWRVAGNRRRIGIRCVDTAAGQTRGLRQAAGYVWEGGEPFYGTRVCPGWYQTGAGVARGCKAPFSALRMLMQSSRKPPESHLQAMCLGGGCDPQATPMRPASHPHASLMRPLSQFLRSMFGLRGAFSEFDLPPDFDVQLLPGGNRRRFLQSQHCLAVLKLEGGCERPAIQRHRGHLWRLAAHSRQGDFL